MSEENEDRLLVEAAQRDPSRFAELYEQNFHRIYACVIRRVGDSHLAEDLTADIFREALTGIQKFQWQGVPFTAWLMGIASRILADHWKCANRESGQTSSDSDPSVSHEIERSAMLFQLVDRLPAAQHHVIYARFVERKSIREIAAELDRSEGAVKQLQLRAIENLRAAMESDR